MLDGLKGLKPILPQLAAPDRGENHERRHRHAPDPDHDGEYMQGTGGDDIIHGIVAPRRDRRPGTQSGNMAISSCKPRRHNCPILLRTSLLPDP
jgi:hypothetical protein